MEKNRENIKRYKKVNTGEIGLPVCFDHSDTVHFYDSENNCYLDFTSGYGVTSTGWLQKELSEAVCNQLKKSAYAPPWLPTAEATELSELILKLVPPNLKYCARATGGADANEIIQKAVFAASGKRKVLSFRRSYHGGTHFTLNISEQEEFNLPPTSTNDGKNIFTEPPDCYRCPFGKDPLNCEFECTRKIESLFKQDDQIGAFFVEPVIGSGGIIIPPSRYWKRIRELCNEFDVFLVFDEVLTGFGRLGSITAADHYNIEPDAISFGKGITNGYAALGVAVLNQQLADGLKKFEDVSSTFAWTPLSCAVAKANIEIILKNDFVYNSRIKGNVLLRKLKEIFAEYYPFKTGDIRGEGLMIGIEIVADQHLKIPDKTFMKKFVMRAFKNGLMLCASWDFRVIVLMPPLCISFADLHKGITIIERTLQQMKQVENVNEINCVS